ncbi:MAG TPA: Calx-beta domain-containing protein, partial [Verrucomicrobiae bacterium]|nr:Calx-beta domain-containing protein [Verrucomicrobiae bacterium]
ASAANFAPGSASLFVIDDESPPPPSNPRPPDLAVNIPANTSLGWDNGTSSEAVTNGGFETGSLAGWTQFNTAFSSFVINNGTYDPPSPDGPLPPFSGTYSTVGSEVGPGIFYLYQDVTIPAGATQALFSWAHRVRNFYSSFNSSQQFQVRVCDTNNNVLATAFSTSATDPLLGDWVQTNFDLSPYIGRTVRLMFWVNPGSYYLDVHLDAISVKAGTVEAGVTNDVYFGTNPTPGPAEFQGNTTNTAWALPLLAPQTTYYWQVVARKVGVGAGPIWRFTTAGLDHFEWSGIASPEGSDIPFPAGITAKDAFNQVVSNFTGQAGLTAVGGIADTNVEDFESGVWPHAPWVSVGGTVLGTVSGAYAHDGNYGLSDPEWIYRTDVSVGKAGESLSVWFRPSSSGRAYLGFAANSGGCLSVVAAQNTGQFMIQQNTGYGFNPLVTNNQSWQVGKWYRMEVQFTSASSVTCNLYDSNGVTLLNSLSASNLTGLPGGVALRSFGGFSLDTLRSSVATQIPVAPANTGSFAGGQWNGQVSVLQAGNGITLVADDGNHHTGRSNPFDVSLANDIAISIVNSSGPVGAGSNLTYTVMVTNIGPQDATDVVVTNRLPSNAFFVSAGTSQGTWDQNGNVVTASLGTIPGGTNATLSILVVPAVGGTVLTNIATVTRGEPDPSPGNNSATNIVVVAPALSIADASVTEGNVGTTNLVFTVTLTPAISQTVSVNYATADGTAMAGSDYVATNGILTFPAGITSRTITVAVKGDTLIEPDESFFVNLSNPINGVLARATATGTIVNDDGLPGQIDHLVWAAIPSTEYSGIPFPATVTALDASNN